MISIFVREENIVGKRETLLNLYRIENLLFRRTNILNALIAKSFQKYTFNSLPHNPNFQQP